MPSVRKLVVLVLFCGAAFLAPCAMSAAGAQAPSAPAPIDLADLHLRVTDSQVVDSVKLASSELKPAKDEKLVVVTLRGKVEKPGRLTVVPATFKARYSWTVSAMPPQEKVGDAFGQAAQISDGTWGTTATSTYTSPKNVTIDVVVSVPSQVTQFYLIWDLKRGLRGPVDLGRKGESRPTPNR